MATLGYPFYPVHPGEIIKDEMEARKISQREFARQVDMSYTVLNELLNGKRSLSPANALMFVCFGYSGRCFDEYPNEI